MRRLAVLFALLWAVSPAFAQSRGLDARLTGYAYPYPVAVMPVEAGGQRLEMAYMDVHPARANGRTVLLLHGKNFSGAYWAPTIRELAAEGYRVVVPDQIGFGKSSKPTDYLYSFHGLAANTATLLDTLGIARAAVVGHSMGGMVAVRFALDYPDRTERLALVNPIGLEDWQRVVPYQTVEAATASEMRQTPAGVRAYMQQSYFGGERRSEYDPLLTIQTGWHEGPDRALMARIAALTSDMVFTQPVLYEFGDLTVPTLLVVGQDDRTAIRKDAAPPVIAATLGDYPVLGRRAAAAIPGARLVELSGVGHVPQVEAFERTIGVLSAFLSEGDLGRQVGRDGAQTTE